MTKRDCIALIPARGGSKRIPQKNIKQFAGKPMIAHAIQNAWATDLFTRVVVSTDSQEIAQIAAQAGAKIPFLRDSEISDDLTGTTAVVQDAIERLDIDDMTQVCLIYATTPLLMPERIKEGFDLIAEGLVEYVFAASVFSSPPQRSLLVNSTGFVEPFIKDAILSRTQDLQPLYYDLGQFYWANAQTWRKGGHFSSFRSKPVILDLFEVCDIDTPQDWDIAEKFYQIRSIK